MPRYIDAEKIEYAKAIIDCFNGRDVVETVAYKKLIDRMPEADVQKVKHGKWIKLSGDFDLCGIDYYKCSQCDWSDQMDTKYCPNCGAKMDLEGK